ncbi:MAG: RDD family protein [Mariprofundaceae bacterium]|nr:RDD family protein [Mariprofundaceae bacterium]
MAQKTAREKAERASVLIRMLAGIYDLGIVMSLAFIAFIPVSLAEQQFGPVPEWMKQFLVTVLVFAYFSGFWVKGGVTTGMRPWHLQVAMIDNGDHPPLSMAVVRCFGLALTWLALAATLMFMSVRDVNNPLFFLSAIIPAISLACMMVTPQRQALHDLLAGTSIYRLKRKTSS